MEEADEEEILDFFSGKGSELSTLEAEFINTHKAAEVVIASNVGADRELEFQTGELRTLREQLAFSRRNVDELVSQQEVLKENIDRIARNNEDLQQNEVLQRDEIATYDGVFAELREAISVGADWTPDQLEKRSVLEKERDFISSKLENKTNMLNGLRADMDKMYDNIQQLEQQNAEIDKVIADLVEKKDRIESSTDKMGAKKIDLEKNIFELRNEIIMNEAKLAEKSAQQKSDNKAAKALEAAIAKSKSQMELYIIKYEQLLRTLQESTSELERLKGQNVKVAEEIEERKASIVELDSEAKIINKEMKKINELRQITKDKCAEVDAEKSKAEHLFDELNKKINMVREVDFVNCRRAVDSVDKQIASLNAEMQVVRKKNIGSEKTTRAMADLIQLNKNGKINLSMEIKVLEEEVEHQQKQIRSLLIEKERFEHDAEIANQQYYTALEELKLQELQISELTKKILVDQAKLKQKQSLYESVRADRNLFSKQLVDSQDEITDLKRKFRSMNHHIDQLKEEISSKDHAIVKEHFMHHSVEKEKELLKNELTKIRKQVQLSDDIIENQRVEIVKLQRIVEEADQERNRQRNEYAAVASERNLLTGQLVKRTFELTQMYERIKTQRAHLRIGERNFQKFQEQLAHWQAQLVEVVHGHNDTVHHLAKSEEVKNRVIQLERDILKEQTKNRALLDELEVPMNVHRWRILESSDPKRFEKVTHIQTLQKQLVDMNDSVVQTDLLIQERERVYVELKNVISRQPGPEVEEQILLYQQTLKDKNKQLGSMNNELDMYMEQVRTFKAEIADIDQEMRKISKKWQKKQRNGGLGGSMSGADINYMKQF